jgi:hypothetical protein
MHPSARFSKRSGIAHCIPEDRFSGNIGVRSGVAGTARPSSPPLDGLLRRAGIGTRWGTARAV